MQEPLFFNLQVFTKVVPAPISVLSGTETSETNCARSHGIGTGVAVGGTSVLVGSDVFVGARGVAVGTMTIGKVGDAAIPPEVGLATPIGVPNAAWVCWAINVWAADV